MAGGDFTTLWPSDSVWNPPPRAGGGFGLYI